MSFDFARYLGPHGRAGDDHRRRADDHGPGLADGLRRAHVRPAALAAGVAPVRRAVGADVKAARLEAIIKRASEPAYKHAHLAHIVRSALQAYQHALETVDVGGLPPAERTRRHLERFMEEVGADLRRGISVLASVGSTAPFIGLLGTVVGIISAFQGIAATGSGGLSAVSAGISEALIETALGLAVAIPAVLVFNYLSN